MRRWSHLPTQTHSLAGETHNTSRTLPVEVICPRMQSALQRIQEFMDRSRRREGPMKKIIRVGIRHFPPIAAYIADPEGVRVAVYIDIGEPI